MRKKLKPRDYPASHFLRPVYAWWGDDWTPQWPSLVKRTSSGHTIADRERQISEGTGWGGGTVAMPKTPKNTRPGWL